MAIFKNPLAGQSKMEVDHAADRLSHTTIAPYAGIRHDIYQALKERMLSDPYAIAPAEWDSIKAAMEGTKPVYTTTDELKKMITQRLRGAPKFDHWEPVYVAKREVVVLFAIKGGEPMFFEDKWDLFPSDAFITQIRLLLA